MWLKRHHEIHNQLAKLIKDQPPKGVHGEIPEVLAKLITKDYGTIEIISLETLENAKRRLALIENDLKTQICNQANLQVIQRKFTFTPIRRRFCKPRKIRRKETP